jgi:RimJ/RimL family protein N-acetyltransferase
MTLETTRLILRPWEESDAESLYKYASDPKVGPVAGWAVHTSVEYSLEIIRGVFSKPEIYAIVLKEVRHPVGCIGLMIGKASGKDIPDTQAEIGYWIGVPYWGRGLITEAAREMLRRGFEDLHLEKIWCNIYEENVRSYRVQEKCGFKFHHTTEKVPFPLDDTFRTVHTFCISGEEWLAER